MPAPTNAVIFDLGDVPLQHGATLRDAFLAYVTYGELNEDRSNVVVIPTWYSSWHDQNDWMIGPDRAIDPSRHFVLVPNMLGNGLSSSPSNTPPPYDRARFPDVTFSDQIEAKYRLLTEKFSVTSIELVTGSSMGAAQTYQWAVSHPELVKRAAPIVGAPVTAEHNQVFLRSLREALRLDPAFAGGWYPEDRWPSAGLRAFARIYAGWGLSQAFYWNRRYADLGFSSLEDFLVGFWEGYWLDDRDPNNLLTLLWCWEHGDVGNTPASDFTPGFGGDGVAALRSIRCPLFAMPARTDLYFPPEDERHWSQFIEKGEVRVLDTEWGHFGGLGNNEPDNVVIDQHLRDLLSLPPAD